MDVPELITQNGFVYIRQDVCQQQIDQLKSELSYLNVIYHTNRQIQNSIIEQSENKG